MPLNRTNLQVLSRVRLREARHLLQARQYSGAYYIAGLAVECALKACIAKKVRRFEFPDKNTVVQSYTHKILTLLKTAGLEQNLDQDVQRNARLEQNWAIVKDWQVDSRYQMLERTEARDLYSAITARQHGVMTWIRQYW